VYKTIRLLFHRGNDCRRVRLYLTLLAPRKGPPRAPIRPIPFSFEYPIVPPLFEALFEALARLDDVVTEADALRGNRLLRTDKRYARIQLTSPE